MLPLVLLSTLLGAGPSAPPGEQRSPAPESAAPEVPKFEGVPLPDIGPPKDSRSLTRPEPPGPPPADSAGPPPPAPAAVAPAAPDLPLVKDPQPTFGVPVPSLFPTVGEQAATGGVAKGPANPDRRGLPPPPIDSPPFPGGEWQGNPVIGIREDTGEQFLMRNLQGTPAGDWLLTNRIKVYGWFDLAANASSSRQSNFPVAYDIFPNTGYLDQAILRFERVLDTAQTSHADWGFKIDNLYGIDYRYTTMKGVFSEQLLEHNRSYGYDPVQWYGLLYIPDVAEGLVLKFGRYVSPPDIEAELALENYVHTHSLTYAYDPYTTVGLLATLRLSPQWSVQAGIGATHDMAPWSTGARPAGFFGIRWVSKSGSDSVYACANNINDARYRGNHDDLQHYVATWSHKFNQRLFTMTEAYYMYQIDAEMGGSENDGPFKTWGGPSGGGAGTTIPGVSSVLGIVNYTELELGKWDYLTFRNDFFDDFQGQRTGFVTKYSTHTVGWCHYVGHRPDIQFRPEVSYDHSYDVPAFDVGTRKNQFLLVANVLVRF